MGTRGQDSSSRKGDIVERVKGGKGGREKHGPSGPFVEREREREKQTVFPMAIKKA